MLSGKRPRRPRLTPSHEHYLRAIWELRARQGYARLTDVARHLGVTPPTISVGLKPLIGRRLVTHDAHRFLLLTPAGERRAREGHHRFAVVRTFLVDVLGVPAAEAGREACRFEHDLSPGTTDRLLDLVKLLHEDDSLRALVQARLAGYRRRCRAEACATCDLTCTVAPPAR